MRIVFVTSSSNLSGGSRQALYTAQGLLERGHELIFFTPADAELPVLAPELPWHRLPPQRNQWGAAIAATLPSHSGSRGITRPCVVHAYHNKAVKLLAWQGLFWRKRGVLTVAQRGVVYRPNNPLPYWSPGIDCFMVNSEACAAVLRKKGVGKERLHVVYNGIPETRVTPQFSMEKSRHEFELPPAAADEVVFGCVANDSDNKGAKVLLEALALLKRSAAKDFPRIRLILAGVTPSRFAEQVEKLHLGAQVHMPGPLQHVADCLQLCDAFVLPSLSESMPNTLQEAVCMGLPVVASSVGGVPECVQGNGLLTPPGDIPALAQALERMARGQEEREQWSQASLKLGQLFSMQHKLDRVEQLYTDHCIRRKLLSGQKSEEAAA